MNWIIGGILFLFLFIIGLVIELNWKDLFGSKQESKK